MGDEPIGSLGEVDAETCTSQAKKVSETRTHEKMSG
jgi:hypothetical protein